MFKRAHTRVLMMLIVSTAGLITTLGLAVYGELKWQLTRDGEAALRGEVNEVQNSLQEASSKEHFALSDARGQNVFFVVTQSGRVVATTAKAPVPFTVLNSTAAQHGFTVFEYQERLYRVLAETVDYNHRTDRLLIYTMIVQEQHALQRVSQVMIFVGILGLIISVAINLKVASSALGPARRTWEVYQDSMIELSHELQTPLATAKALLNSRTQDVSLQRAVNAELDRASEMVRNIMYLSKLRSQPMVTSNVPVAVSDVTEDVVERFKPLAEKRGILLTGKASQGLFVDTTLDAWDRLVSTVLKNVVDHALPGSSATWEVQSIRQLVRLTVNNTALSAVDTTDVMHDGLQPFVRGFGLQIIRKLAGDMRGRAYMERVGNQVTMVVEVPKLKSRRRIK